MKLSGKSKTVRFKVSHIAQKVVGRLILTLLKNQVAIRFIFKYSTGMIYLRATCALTAFLSNTYNKDMHF